MNLKNQLLKERKETLNRKLTNRYLGREIIDDDQILLEKVTKYRKRELEENIVISILFIILTIITLFVLKK